MNILSEILSSKIRAEIFHLLFGIANEELHMREIERRSGYIIGTVQTELKKLLRLNLVIKRRDGNRLYYRANKDHPLYPDIHNIILKTVGLTDVLKKAIEHHPDIHIAFVFGSIANHNEKAESDVDLMVIGSLGLRILTRLLSGITQQIGREINPHVLTIEEFMKRKAKKDHFIIQVVDSPRIMIKGNDDEFKAMAQ
jgi:uncharacterized protein